MMMMMMMITVIYDGELHFTSIVSDAVFRFTTKPKCSNRCTPTLPRDPVLLAPTSDIQ